MEEVADHWLAQVRTGLVLHHVKRHRSEYLPSLSVVPGTTSFTLIGPVLNTRWRSVVWTDAFGYKIILIGGWDQLLLEVSSTSILTINFQLLIVVWYIHLLLTDVNHRRVQILMWTLLIGTFHSCGNVTLVLDHFKVLNSIILTVKVLGCMIEHLHLVHVLNLVDFLLQLIVFDFVVKASSS